MIDALRHLLRKGKGTEDVPRELTFFRNDRRRMHYAAAAAAGFAIGSGSVESANRVPVTSRMKPSGPRRRLGRPDLPVAAQVRALRPGMGRAGSEPEPQRRLRAPAMRQRERGGREDGPRRVIRERNIMKSKGEPYENHSPLEDLS